MWKRISSQPGVTSNNNQSNSYTLCQRQAWAALDNVWSITGGQMSSLFTETKHGMDHRTEALPMTIDPRWTVGFSWARQYGVRLTKNLGNKVWFAVAARRRRYPPTTCAGSDRQMPRHLGRTNTVRVPVFVFRESVKDPICAREGP